jgi:ribosome assembly protein YihI (activator of Der GTPase)
MVQRARAAREGGKRPAARKDQASPAMPMTDASQRLAMVEAERDRLQASLDAAEARIAELEKTRALVVNRIDWLIDSLGTAIEKRA